MLTDAIRIENGELQQHLTPTWPVNTNTEPINNEVSDGTFAASFSHKGAIAVSDAIKKINFLEVRR
jgi:hypothetical protein